MYVYKLVYITASVLLHITLQIISALLCWRFLQIKTPNPQQMLHLLTTNCVISLPEKTSTWHHTHVLWFLTFYIQSPTTCPSGFLHKRLTSVYKSPLDGADGDLQLPKVHDRESKTADIIHFQVQWFYQQICENFQLQDIGRKTANIIHLQIQ